MAKIQKGEIRNPKGRPKGLPNRNTAELKDMILTALESAGGADYLKKQAIANPGPFMALVGKILPRDINAKVDFVGELADRLKEARERTGRS